MQSIALRPGRLKSGRITLLSIAPKSSSRPKLSNKGSNKPANRKTENRVGRRSCRTSPPVFSFQTASGPTWKNVIRTAPPPMSRTANQIGVGLSKLFKKGLPIIKAGFNSLVIIDATEVKAITAVVIATILSPSNALTDLASTATGMVSSPAY